MNQLKLEPIPMIVDQEAWPVPPYPYVLSDQVELVCRLRSTRSGANARWWAGEQAKQCLNDSRYQPIFRAIVEDFSWAPAHTKDNHNPLWEPPRSEARIFQGGSAVLNWTAKVVSPLPDEGRKIIALVITLEPREEKSQGSLKVRPIAPFFPEDAVPWAGSGVKWLYNHMVYPCSRYLWRVMGGIAHAIVQASDDTWILSPDHPGDPIRLEYRSWYWLSHPLPRNDIGGTD